MQVGGRDEVLVPDLVHEGGLATWRLLYSPCGSPFMGPRTTFFRAQYVGRPVS